MRSGEIARLVSRGAFWLGLEKVAALVSGVAYSVLLLRWLGPTKFGIMTIALAGVGCHDEKRIFFTLDTRLPWLVPGAAFTYTAAMQTADFGALASSPLAVRIAQIGAPKELYRRPRSRFVAASS